METKCFSKDKVLLDYMKLKYLCKKNSWTIASLAKEIGVTRQTVASWGRNGTECFNIWIIEDVFKLQKNELVLSH